MHFVKCPDFEAARVVRYRPEHARRENADKHRKQQPISYVLRFPRL
jgi:hypothetical protein